MKKKSREIVSGCKDNSDRMVYLNQDAILIINKLFEVRNLDDTDIDYLFLNPLSDDGKLHYNIIFFQTLYERETVRWNKKKSSGRFFHRTDRSRL